MDKKRFVAFRSDLVKLKHLIVEKTAEEVEKIFDELVVAYPELHTHEDSLPDLSVKRGGKEQCSQKRDDIKLFLFRGIGVIPSYSGLCSRKVRLRIWITTVRFLYSARAFKNLGKGRTSAAVSLSAAT